MHRLRFILGSVLALAFVAGSGVIVYYDRPVMRLRDAAANAAPSVATSQPAAGGTVTPPAPREREGGSEDEGESEEGEDDGGAALPINPAPAPAPAPSPAPSPAPAPAPSPAPAPAPAPGTYSMTDVRQHATTASCWSAINGSVYDLTDWINRHPGGSYVIIGLCGSDGSAAYNGQHGGQQRPQYYLSLLKIGSLR